MYSCTCLFPFNPFYKVLNKSKPLCLCTQLQVQTTFLGKLHKMYAHQILFKETPKHYNATLTTRILRTLYVSSQKISNVTSITQPALPDQVAATIAVCLSCRVNYRNYQQVNTYYRICTEITLRLSIKTLRSTTDKLCPYRLPVIRYR